MAYMSQEKKKEIAAELKKVIPANWKYSLSVEHHSTLHLTIWEAPINLVMECVELIRKSGRTNAYDSHTPEHFDVNEHWLDTQFEGKRLEQMKKIVTCLNVGNHNNSDSMTDYFDVGWYVQVKFGRYDRPFRVTGQETIQEKIAKLEQENIELRARVN